MKSKLLLLDANVIIAANEIGLWKTIYTQFDVYVPSVVLKREAKFFKSKETGESNDIELDSLLKTSQIKEIEATIDEIIAMQDKFVDTFLEVLGDGEKEAIAIIIANKLDGARFITADGPAIKALGALMMSSSAGCFEHLLEEIKQAAHVNKLPHHHKKDFFDKNIRDGFTNSRLYVAQ